jgi:nitrogen-specific signal transduction histidine kinase/ActR/RegA family two-component response regulator
VKGIMAVLEDLSPRRQLEERLLHSQKMEAIGRLAGGVAHDFNNLLTAITGHAQILLENVPEGNPERADLLEIDRAAARAASLTKQLLAFSRKQVLQPAVLDLNALVAGIERMLRRLIGEDIELATVLDPAAGRIKADPGQIEQVVMNLVVNARDAMPQGGTIVVETSNVRVQDDPAEHGGAPAGDYVQLAITDSGVGMDRDTLSHIFEPFFTTKGPSRGTGLGLSMVYGFVQQSGGEIGVDSRVGSGTTISLRFPAAATTAAAEAAPAAAPPPEASSRPTAQILFVEDDVLVSMASMQLLEDLGHTVYEASNATRALALLDAHPEIELLVSDVGLPGMNGHEMAAEMRRRRPDLKILFVTGYDRTSTRRRTLDGDTDYLAKPYQPEDLDRAVRRLLKTGTAAGAPQRQVAAPAVPPDRGRR